MSTAEDLAPRAARGASYVTAGQLVRTAVLFVSTIVLSRLLAPDDFGLMAISLSVLALGELIRDSGLALAAARAVPLSRGQKSNLFWINLGLGLATGVVTFLLAAPLADIFKQPELEQMLHWMSLSLLLSGYSTQFRAELNRHLRFARLTIVDTLPAAVGLGVGIVWALVDPTFWALVAQQVSTAAAGAILASLLSGWWPGLPTRESVREFVGFGAALLGAQTLAYGARNADNFFIGYAWGPTALGYYSRAYQLLMAPMNQLLVPLTRVAVPVLSRSVDDPSTFNRRILSAQLVAGAPLSIAYAALCGLGAPALLILLGPNWVEAIPIFQALCVGGIFRALNQATYWAFVSSSKTKSFFRLSLVTQPLIIVCMLAGLPWGPLGVAWGHSIGYAATWLISALWCARVTIVRAAGLFQQAAVVLLLFVAPVIAITLMTSLFELPPLAHLAVGIAGALAWIGVVSLTIPPARRAFGTMLRLVRMTMRRTSSDAT